MSENKINWRNILLVIGIPVVVFLAILTMTQGSSDTVKLEYSDFIKYFNPEAKESEYIEKYEISLEKGKVQLVFNKEGEKVMKDDPKYEKIKVLNKETGEKEDRGALIYDVPDLSIFLTDLRIYQDRLTNAVYLNALDEATRERYDNSPLRSVNYDYFPKSDNGWIGSVLPTAIMIIVFVFVWFIFMRQMNNQLGEGSKQFTFGKAKFKNVADEKRKTTFEDVAGADEEKEELQEIVEFLKSPKKFDDLGAHIPKGVLLVGPPGTGKTLLARAVAGEAGVPFFSISGSDFVEMFVGVGASRVRDLFDQAKKNLPCIVFIDEIDAVGRHRGSGLGGGHDEREQTLNQLLVEMDGFGVNEGVIIIAATNRPDILDKALTRPGRFDRQIMVGYPDIKGREQILKVHSRKKPLGPDVDLNVIAKTTAGFTGADLENLLNEAALLAARRGLKAITSAEIAEATIKVLAGTEKRSKVITPKEKHSTAVHESGHAILAHFCKTQDPVHEISIIPRGMAGGYTLSLPQEDRLYRIKSEMLEEIIVLLGGRAAEFIVLADISTGASNDIERATRIARDMVMKYGMSDRLGPINFGSSEGGEIFLGRDMGHVKDFSDEVAHEIDLEVKRIIDESYEKAEAMLSEHRVKLDALTEALVEMEKLDGEQFKSIMGE